MNNEELYDLYQRMIKAGCSKLVDLGGGELQPDEKSSPIYQDHVGDMATLALEHAAELYAGHGLRELAKRDFSSECTYHLDPREELSVWKELEQVVDWWEEYAQDRESWNRPTSNNWWLRHSSSEKTTRPFLIDLVRNTASGCLVAEDGLEPGFGIVDLDTLLGPDVTWECMEIVERR